MSETNLATALRIGVLGPVRVARDDADLDVGGPKQRAVLAMLVAESGRAVSRDRIINGVWGEAGSDANVASFQTYVSNLRAAIGDVIERVGTTYRLDLEPDGVDAWAFEREVADARTTLASDPGSTAMRLREALSWWRGRPYADLIDIPGLDAEVRRLDELRLEAVELRIDAELASGLHGSMIGELEGLAEEYPLRERFRAQHMLALYRSGRAGEALRAYRRTETLLAEELGVEPSQELRDLELMILQHDDSLLGGRGREVTQRLTFLVTDIEGSTAKWDRAPEVMAEALATHDRILREAIDAHSGNLFKHTGDGVLAAFPDAPRAVRAAEAMLRALEMEDWGELGALRIRIGIDSGEAEARGGDFFGPPLNRAARLCAAGHGGQVLVSSSVQAEVTASSPAGLQVRHLGEVHLRGMAEPEPVAQLVFVGLPADFPELRTGADSALDDRSQLLSLPGYEVRDRIGEGAFGVVWRAYQPSVGREVAIKVIRSELASQPSFLRRFEAEARTVARLAHPHIVPLIDFWRDGDSAYLVLALLPGGSLHSTLRNGPIDRRNATRILSHVGGALDHAHSQGIAHGDVKPANVLLDGAGNAYLSDFGIAGRLLGHEMVASMSTAPEYRAPEETETGPTPATDLYALGVLAREVFAHEDSIESVLARATSSNPADRYPTASAFLTALTQALGEDPEETAQALVTRNPYKGLRAFDESDASDFYGRDELVSTMVAAVTERRFVTVVGPSGSGKSSVVRAGLLPALVRGAIDGSEGWFRVTLTPGPDPMSSLVEALGQVSVNPIDHDALRQMGLGGVVAGDLLVVVDQFEEVYTLADPEQRRIFLDTLTEAVNNPDSGVRVVATLRADFYDRPLEDETIGRLVRDGLVTVLPPTRDEMVAMISLPAQTVGLRWEPGLPHRIAEDVAHQPGGLPLLQYALTELVERRSGDLLTSADYAEVGGVGGALAIRAETLYQTLTPAQQEAVRQILLRLVTVDEDTDDTRRRVRRSELESIGIPRSDLDTVLAGFTSQRLLLADRDPATRGPTVEVTHEALLREWPRLTGWVDDQREALILGRRFRAELTEWENADRDDDYLLTGSRLAPFMGWAETAALTGEEQDYYRASRAKDDEDRNARRRRRRTLVGVLGAATVVATTLGVVAAVQAGRASQEADRATEAAQLAEDEAARAEAEARLARSRELAASATVALESDPTLAKLLALASAELAPLTVDTLSVLHAAYARDVVTATYQATAHPDGQVAEFIHTEVHPDGRLLVASSTWPGSGQFLEVHDFETSETLWTYDTGRRDIVVYQAQFAPDQNAIAGGVIWDAAFAEGAAAPDRQALGVHIWDATTGELIRHFDVGECGGAVREVRGQRALVQVLPDCEHTVPEDLARLQLLDLVTGETVTLSEQSVWDAADISEDGTRVAFREATEEWGATVVLDVETGERILDIDGDPLFFFADPLVLSPDGTLLLTRGRPTEIWDVDSAQLVRTLGERTDSWEIDAENTAYSVDQDAILRVWNLDSGIEVATYPKIGRGTISLADDGRIVVTDAGAGRAVLVDLTPGEVWGIATCGEFVHTRSLRAVGGHAAFFEYCGPGTGTHVIDTVNRQYLFRNAQADGQDLALSPDGQLIVHQELGESPTGEDDGKEWIHGPKVRHLLTGELVAELEGPCIFDHESIDPTQDEGCNDMPDIPFAFWNSEFDWSSDGDYIVAANSATLTRPLIVWDARTGELVATPGPICHPIGPYGPVGLHITDDDVFMACIGESVITAVSRETWEVRHTNTLPDDLPGAAVFYFITDFPDQGLLLGVSGIGDAGDPALVWIDSETLEVVDVLPGIHDGGVSAWAVNDDRSLVATASIDGQIRVWDVAAKAVTQQITLTGRISGLAFLSDTELAVTPTEGGGFYVFTLDPDELLEITYSSLRRGFTPEECIRYDFGDACPSLEELRP